MIQLFTILFLAGLGGCIVGGIGKARKRTWAKEVLLLSVVVAILGFVGLTISSIAANRARSKLAGALEELGGGTPSRQQQSSVDFLKKLSSTTNEPNKAPEATR